MKRLCPLLVVLLLLCSMTVPVLATGEDATPEDSPVIEVPTETITETVVTEDEKTININVTVPAVTALSETEVSATDTVAAAWADDVPVVEAEPVYPSYTMTTLDDTTPAADEAGLASVMDTVFGCYTPRTQTVTEYLADGTSVTYQEYVPGLAGLDWEWLGGVMLFSVMLFCFLKMIGGMLT